MHTDTVRRRPLGWTRHGRPVWPIAGGSEDGPPADPPPDPANPPVDPPPDPQPDPANAPPDPPDKGFPADAPVAEMTAVQQAAYWKDRARKHEDRVKARSDYDAVKAKADRFDALEREQLSDVDKATADAVAARAETAEVRAAMVDTHIAAAVTAGRISQDHADVLLDGLDRSKYLSDGRVDTDKVTALLNAIAPATGAAQTFPDLGQGRRHGSAKPSVASGRDMFDARREQRKTS